MQKPYYNAVKQYGETVAVNSLDISGTTNSPRVNGHLWLQFNNLGSWDKRSERGSTIYYSVNGGERSYVAVRSNVYGHLNHAWMRYSDELRDEAVRKAYAKMNSTVANVGDLIRTRRESAKMVLSTVSQLVKAARHLRHGRPDLAFYYLRGEWKPSHYRAGDFVGQRWLEYSYGWAPLVQDIYNLLNKGFGEVNFRVSGAAKDLQFYSYDDSNQNPYATTFTSGTEILQYKSRYIIDCVVNDSAIAPISAWQLDNPASVMWEALPYSFVVDWFLPIGDYIDNACNLTQGKVIPKSAVMVDTVTQSISGRCSVNPRSGYDPNSGFWEMNLRLKSRTVGIRSYPIPSFKNPFSFSQRLANQLALLKLELSRRVIR